MTRGIYKFIELGARPDCVACVIEQRAASGAAKDVPSFAPEHDAGPPGRRDLAARRCRWSALCGAVESVLREGASEA